MEAARRNWTERVVKVNRIKLLDKLYENRTKHREEYLEALDGYVELATKKLDRKYKIARAELEGNFKTLQERIAKFDKNF